MWCCPTEACEQGTSLCQHSAKGRQATQPPRHSLKYIIVSLEGASALRCRAGLSPSPVPAALLWRLAQRWDRSRHGVHHVASTAHVNSLFGSSNGRSCLDVEPGRTQKQRPGCLGGEPSMIQGSYQLWLQLLQRLLGLLHGRTCTTEATGKTNRTENSQQAQSN